MGQDRIKRMFRDFVQQPARTGEGGRNPVSRRPLVLIPTHDILSLDSDPRPARPANTVQDTYPDQVARVMSEVHFCHRRAQPRTSGVSARTIPKLSSSDVDVTSNVLMVVR